eukprot:12381413-Alexandrium_andersonii.AAC.1
MSPLLWPGRRIAYGNCMQPLVQQLPGVQWSPRPTRPGPWPRFRPPQSTATDLSRDLHVLGPPAADAPARLGR